MSADLIPDEVLKKFVGFPIGKKIFRVKGKDMVEFAKAIGETRPEYITPAGTKEDGKPDFSNIIGHPAYPAMWALSAAAGVEEANYTDDKGKKWKLDVNMAKLLHTAQEYDYKGCVPIKDGDKLYTFGKLADANIKGSPGKELLFVTIDEETKNDKGELVVRIKVAAGIRKGGYKVKEVA
ncbi:MAG: hypothetical protein RBG13Loki_0084 [Promethearchaeota archaeon CR_4]|nr:MAG: hypothetical protein RBG13Loki_0084 [Candidatus Lokiarchaeota archaeon CR_4]